MIKPYPTATLVMNCFGYIHAWRGKAVPQESSGRRNFQVDGKDSTLFFQKDASIEAIIESLPEGEKSLLLAGFVIRTNFFCDEYFGA